MQLTNLYERLPAGRDAEAFEEILNSPGLRIERIVSSGQATPAGEWFDQDDDEWVVLLGGAAELRFEGESQARTLRPGDFLYIAAHERHRVEWTQADPPTVWLAVHFRNDSDPTGVGI